MATKATIEDWTLLVDSNRGVYVPQQFAQYFDSNIKEADKAVLLAGPDHDDYWDIWDDVLDYCKLEIANVECTLHQDSDLWAVPASFDWDTYESF